MHGLILLALTTCLPPSACCRGPRVGRQVQGRWDSLEVTEKAGPVTKMVKGGYLGGPKVKQLKQWEASEVSEGRGECAEQSRGLWWWWEVVKKDHELSHLLNWF